MSYVIKKSDGTTFTTIGEGLTDESSSLILVGKNVSNFGVAQNQNFLRLLENFASDIEPPNKMRGQAWYDTNSRTLKFYNGGDWVSLGSMQVSETQPDTAHDGYFWFNPTSKKLYVSSGTNYVFVGPENTEGYGDTRMISDTMTDPYSAEHPVIKVSVGDEILAIVSADTFISTDGINGFTSIRRGVNLKNVDSVDTNTIINGRSRYATLSDVAMDIAGGTAGSLVYQSGTSSTSFLSIGSANTILTSDGTNISWGSLSSLAIGSASKSTNIAGGSFGSIPYQSAANNTTFVTPGSTGQILVADSGSGPSWKNASSLTVGYAVTSTYTLSAGTATVAVTRAVSDSSNNIATTNFVHSVLPVGSIIMWSGDSSTIPAGWHLCDGSTVNGHPTPNLLNRFIVAAGETYGANTTGGASTASVVIAAAGGHNHGGYAADHTLTEAEMPNHGHLVDDIRWSEVGGTFSYNDPMLGPISTGPGIGSDEGNDGDNGVFFLTHGTYKTGGNAAHRHSIASVANHTHLVDTVNFTPLYYALCYIMKVV